MQHLHASDPHSCTTHNRPSSPQVPEQDYDVLIVSYDYMSKLKEELKRQAFRVVVCDESHCIKNHTSERSKSTVPLVQVRRTA